MIVNASSPLPVSRPKTPKKKMPSAAVPAPIANAAACLSPPFNCERNSFISARPSK